ncbi:adenine nucleotide alpha hydrolases-like superfamily protein isoform X2 [Wolffia australiana]
MRVPASLMGFWESWWTIDCDRRAQKKLIWCALESSCSIAACEWSDGRPKKGHVQEAAREKRYQIFREICHEQRISVLFVAHHADDQAELFILRLSRGSGILGLAGMAFVSQLFHSDFDGLGDSLNKNGLLTVRPLLQFSKDDMYKICVGSSQEWVEDPSNLSPIYVRNRIRILLKDLPSDTFRSELQALISACRVTRSYVDQICHHLIQQCVMINDHGYAVIDLSKLDPSNVEDLCLSKLLAVILQFISQRHKPVRGAASKLLLDYIRTIPCKTSLTVAYCYLSPVPKSKGTMVMVTIAQNSPTASEAETQSRRGSFEKQRILPDEINDIISHLKELSHSSDFPPLLNSTSTESILGEAIRLKIISESTHDSLLLLQKEESENFKVSAGLRDDSKAKRREKAGYVPPSVQLHPGESCHFMGRFMVSWEERSCGSCRIPHDVAFLRHMVDGDWLYLVLLSNSQMAHHQDYARESAKKALQAIKSIPAPARRGLPVLVNSEGLPLCIPNICFSHCPDLKLTARFEPRVPLGGGFSSFL